MASASSAAADPARALRVLWRTDEPASRPGKPDLSVDRIAAVAIMLADAHGLGAVSMRRVADELGVGTMSIYTYVPGKAELVEVMIDMVAGETARPTGRPEDWRARLRQVADENWALFLRHPWVLQVGRTRPPLGPATLAKYEYELGALEGIGLTDLEMDSVLTLVLGHAEITARRAADASRATESSGLSDEAWWAEFGPVLAQLIDSETYPLASRVGTAAGEAYQAPADPRHEFEFGLARILDGVQTLLAQRTTQNDHVH